MRTCNKLGINFLFHNKDSREQTVAINILRMETEKEQQKDQEQENNQDFVREEKQINKEPDSDIKKAVTEDEILLAALKLFTKKGYFNTSLADIAQQAGAGTASKIYQHFKNKQAIASTLYANILDSMSCSIDDIRRRNQKSSDQLREIVDLMFSLTDEAPEIMQFLLIMKLDEFLPDEKPLLKTAPFLKISKILQAGIKNKEIRSADAKQAYTYFFGIINHTLILVLTGVLEKKAEAYQSNAWVTAWNAIAKK